MKPNTAPTGSPAGWSSPARHERPDGSANGNRRPKPSGQPSRPAPFRCGRLAGFRSPTEVVGEAVGGLPGEARRASRHGRIRRLSRPREAIRAEAASDARSSSSKPNSEVCRVPVRACGVLASCPGKGAARQGDGPHGGLRRAVFGSAWRGRYRVSLTLARRLGKMYSIPRQCLPASVAGLRYCLSGARELSRSENQSLQIALIVFVILTLVLAGTTFSSTTSMTRRQPGPSWRHDKATGADRQEYSGWSDQVADRHDHHRHRPSACNKVQEQCFNADMKFLRQNLCRRGSLLSSAGGHDAEGDGG